MTQEDQLENSHQPSNSVCDQVNDDLIRQINSKNTMVKIHTRNVNQQRKNLNKNSVNVNNCDNNCVLKSNMGAAITVASEKNKSTIASSLPSSSSSPPPASSISLSSSDQLPLLSAVELASAENNKNKDHLENDNKTVENIKTATAPNDTIPIANVEVHQQHQQHQQQQQQQKSLVDTSKKLLNANCDSVNVINDNNSKMTVIKSQNSGENIREIIQMKIDGSNKINNDNNASTTEENQKSSENTGNSENENKLNEVIQNVKQGEEHLNDIKNNLLVSEDKTNKYSGSEIVADNNKNIDEVKKISSIETENLKNKNDKVDSVDGAVVKNLSVDGDIKSKKDLRRRSKERSISQDIEDPLARLKALKANISNALKEVKAVLSEHGEPVTPEKPEKSTDEIQNNSTDSGVVNFRFVKKIRRRSTFEEDKNAITEIIVNQIVDNQEKMDKDEKDQSQTDVKINEKIEQLPESLQKIQHDKSNENVSAPQSEEVVSVKSESKDEMKNMKNKTENANEQTKENVVTVGIQNANEESEPSNKKKISPKVKKSKDNESSAKTDKSEEKKPTKNGTRKLVKRNSQDGATKNSTLVTTAEEKSEQQSESKKSDESDALSNTAITAGNQSVSDTVSSVDGDNKKKIVKKVSNGKKSVKTTDSKTANERRASIATAQASEEVISKSPVLEKRRSSTSRLVIKKKQTKDLENTQTKELNDLKKSENIPVKPKISTISSSESTTEIVLDKIKAEQESIIPAKENKANNERMKEITSSEKIMNKSNEKIITPRNSLSSITESEKENIAPHAETDDSAKKTIQVAVKSTSTTAIASKVEEKTIPTPSAITESKSIAAPKSIQSNVPVKTEPTKISFGKPANVIQKPSQNEKPVSENVSDQAAKVEKVNKQPSSTNTVVAITAETTTTTETTETTVLKVEEKIVPTTAPEITESKMTATPKPTQTNAPVKTEPTKISVGKSANVVQKPSQSMKPTSENVLNQATKVEDNSSQVVNKQLSSTSKVIATTAGATKTTSNIAATIQTDKSTEKALSSNLTSQVSSTNVTRTTVNEASKSPSNVATQSPSIDPSQAEPTNCPEKELGTSESIEASSSAELNPDDPQANSKSPLVRNEITEKLAGLKPKPLKMPVVMKSNLEMNKIHPVMVLHMAPPKNASFTTFQKTPQKGTLDEIAPAENTEKVIHKKSSDGRKRKMKKVVIRRMKRRLSLDTPEDKPSDTEIEEKEIASKIPGIEEGSEIEKIPSKKSCLKMRVYEPGETVMYADRVKKIMKWRKAIVLDKITSISYKLDVEGEEKPAHISYIKKYTDKKVHFGGKEYLEIDYAEDDDDDDEEEEKYNIWARV